MKKIIYLLGLIFILLLTGCDNNEGPFNTKIDVDGRKILFAKGKPVNGVISEDIVNGYKKKVGEIKINYKDGYPDKKFSVYNSEEQPIMEGKGEWIDNNIFNGTLTFYMYEGNFHSNFNDPKKNYKEILEGKMAIQQDSLFEAMSNDIFSVASAQNLLELSNKGFSSSLKLLVDGTISNGDLKLTIKNKKPFEGSYMGKIDEIVAKNWNYTIKEYQFTQSNGYQNSPKKQIFSEENYNKIDNSVEKISYYENGNKKLIKNYKGEKLHGKLTGYMGEEFYIENYNNDVLDGVSCIYEAIYDYKNKLNKVGILREIKTYKNGKLHGKLKKYDEEGRIEVISYYYEGKREGITINYNYTSSDDYNNGEYRIGIEKTNYLFKDGKVLENYRGFKDNELEKLMKKENIRGDFLIENVFKDALEEEKEYLILKEKLEKLFNEKSYLSFLKEESDEKVQYYPSGRVKILPSYDGDYLFEDRDLTSDILQLNREFKSELEKEENLENMKKFIDDIEFFIIAEKLNKNITKEGRKEIIECAIESRWLYKEFYKKMLISETFKE